MDNFSLIGLTLGALALCGGHVLEGGHLLSLVNVPAALIVLGGTLAAALIETPPAIFLRALKISIWFILPPPTPFENGIQHLVEWSRVSRKDGLIGLENIVSQEKDPFLQHCLQMMVDGAPLKEIRSLIELELETRETEDLAAANVFESMGGYAPTMGIIGAVLGLIHVMGNLASPDKLGPGIATAFVATIYGVASANLVFIPLAKKLKKIIEQHTFYRIMMLEGILSIADGVSPRTIENRMGGFT